MIAEVSAPSGRPRKSGISRKNQRITITSGIERSTLTYAAAGSASHGFPDRRIRAMTVPSAMPPSIAMIVSSTEKIRPLRTKLWTSAQLKKPKSRFTAPPSLRAEQSRHLDAPLDQRGKAVDRERRDEVERGH